MKKIVLMILLCGTMILGVVGCSNEKPEKMSTDSQKELFMLGITLDDGRHVFFSIEVPYLAIDDSDLFDALTYRKITVEDFLSQLDYVGALWDGGSKLYYYNNSKKEFGSEDFYAISCNSLDNIKDIYIARDRESLMDKCSMKINDLENVSMTIKDGTLTKTGATVIIKDISKRNNIYGESYQLEKKENGMWIELKPKHDMVFTSIGYSVDKNNSLELKVNWEYHYGELKSGTYRILKDTSYAGEGTRHYITAEFTIE